MPFYCILIYQVILIHPAITALIGNHRQSALTQLTVSKFTVQMETITHLDSIRSQLIPYRYFRKTFRRTLHMFTRIFYSQSLKKRNKQMCLTLFVVCHRGLGLWVEWIAGMMPFPVRYMLLSIVMTNMMTWLTPRWNILVHTSICTGAFQVSEGSQTVADVKMKNRIK